MKYLFVIMIILMSSCDKANYNDDFFALKRESCKLGCIYSEISCLEAIKKLGFETGVWPPPKFVDAMCVEPKDKCVLKCEGGEWKQ